MCIWMPEGYKMTVTQWTIFYIVFFGTNLLLTVNGLFYFVYRAEWQFIEQFKVEKDQAWPWNQDR